MDYFPITKEQILSFFEAQGCATGWCGGAECPLVAASAYHGKNINIGVIDWYYNGIHQLDEPAWLIRFVVWADSQGGLSKISGNDAADAFKRAIQ